MVQGRFEGTEMRAPAAMLGGQQPGERHHHRSRHAGQADNSEWRQLMMQPAHRTALNEVLA